MKKRIFTSVLIAIAGVGLMAGSASASLLNGGISLAGGFEPTGGLVGDLSDATGIDFNGDLAIVTSVSGDFGVLTPFPGAGFDVATMHDFVFNPFVAASPLWEIDNDGDAVVDFWFDLTALTFIDQDPDHLDLKGTGTLYAVGYDPTPGTWILTGNQADQTFSWSSSNAAVPEPATMLLFGSGLAGLAALRRRRTQK